MNDVMNICVMKWCLVVRGFLLIGFNLIKIKFENFLKEFLIFWNNVKIFVEFLGIICLFYIL